MSYIKKLTGLNYYVNKYLGLQKIPETLGEEFIWNSVLHLADFINKRDTYNYLLKYRPLDIVCRRLIVDLILDDMLDDMSSELNKIRIFLKEFEDERL